MIGFPCSQDGVTLRAGTACYLRVTIDKITFFCYLGSMVASSGDLQRRRGLAWTAFWKLERLWKDQSHPLQTKLPFFQATCLSMLLHRCQLWVLMQDMTNKINSFVTSRYRIMLNIKHTDRVSNDEVYSKVGTGPLVSIVIQHQLRSVGHQLHMPCMPCMPCISHPTGRGSLADNRQK